MRNWSGTISFIIINSLVSKRIINTTQGTPFIRITTKLILNDLWPRALQQIGPTNKYQPLWPASSSHPPFVLHDSHGVFFPKYYVDHVTPVFQNLWGCPFLQQGVSVFWLTSHDSRHVSCAALLWAPTLESNGLVSWVGLQAVQLLAPHISIQKGFSWGLTRVFF